MFVAVEPPPEVVDEIDAFLEPRRAVGDLRWSDPAAWHITLAFFAAVPDRDYEELVEALAEAVARTEGFPLRCRGAGAFPDPVGSRALWLGVEDPTGRLAQLAARTRTAGHRSGVPADGTAFRAHLTVARGRPQHRGHLVQALDTFEGSDWQVEAVDLVESHLGEGPRRSPRYERRETFALA